MASPEPIWREMTAPESPELLARMPHYHYLHPLHLTLTARTILSWAVDMRQQYFWQSFSADLIKWAH